MSDFNSGLSLDEAFAAVREIAKIHAVSWAMQEATNQALDDKWPFAYRTQTAASTYKVCTIPAHNLQEKMHRAPSVLSF